MNNLNSIVEKIIFEVFESLDKNNFKALGKPKEPMFEKPLIGVAAGDDPYFYFLKEHIGEFHWSPSEAFAKIYKNTPKASNLRVLSLIFPQSEATIELQNRQIKVPCDNWYASRAEWESVMDEFLIKLLRELEIQGIKAVAVDLIKDLSVQQSEKLGQASNWSHRHAAFAAGMGTFGLSDGFISERGKAVRITSIIIEADLDITPRTYTGPYDWCLYYKSGICGACIRRCPKRAITEKGHDKEACSLYKDTVCAESLPGHLSCNNRKIPCGLCQTKIPCGIKRP